MTKAELRKKYKAGSLSIANQLLTLNIWEHKFYHLFLSIETQKEVNTDFILNILSGKDKNIVVSKSDFKTNTLQNFLLTDATTLKQPMTLKAIELVTEKGFTTGF